MNAVVMPRPVSLVERCAARFGVDANKLLPTLKATAFRQRAKRGEEAPEITNEQMMSLLIVAEQYGLNPFTKEIYAYLDRSGGIIPVVGVDGWSRIVNQHPQFDGMEFRYSEESTDHKGRKAFEWIECTIHRKDRAHSIPAKEWFDEVVREQSYETPWDTHPKRMHRHKAFIQAARLAFGFVGIYDPDEGRRIMDAIDVTPTPEPTASRTEALKKTLQARRPPPAAPIETLHPDPLPPPETGQTDWPDPDPAELESLEVVFREEVEDAQNQKDVEDAVAVIEQAKHPKLRELREVAAEKLGSLIRGDARKK